MSIRHWLFDLDNTLYSAKTDFFSQVSDRITIFIADYLSIDHEQAGVLRRRYWKEYGTSLRGMMIHHGMDPEPYLAYVHDVPMENALPPDPEVRALVQRCGPGPRHIFTNSSAEHARRVLAALQLVDLFDNIFDIRHSDFVPKPGQQAYERVVAALGASPRDCLFIDDSPQNLVAARQYGMRTVWLCTDTAAPLPSDSVADLVIHDLRDLHRALAEADAVALFRPSNAPLESAG